MRLLFYVNSLVTQHLFRYRTSYHHLLVAQSAIINIRIFNAVALSITLE